MQINYLMSANLRSLYFHYVLNSYYPVNHPYSYPYEVVILIQ
jgi:hypothetical protein